MTETGKNSTADVSFAPKRAVVGRVRGGIAALAYPFTLVMVSLSVGFRKAGDLSDFAASFVASILTVVALPTVWIVSFDFIELTRMTVLTFGVLTSLPLWYLLGAFIGERAGTWGTWIRAYLSTCLLWTLANFVVLAIIASVVS
jgi:hypothetical protein